MRLFIFAGEHSGDLHGSYLLKQLRTHLPTASFFGVGGPKMRALDFGGPFTTEDFSVMGFSDVFFNLPKIVRQFNAISQLILKNPPEAVVLIDYPDFNLRLAKRLRKRGYKGKIIHYISPSVWAWRKNRIQTMAKTLDLLLTIYPFEADYYENSSLPVTFVGNPLSEYLSNYPYNDQWKEGLEIPDNLPIIALFPGSRHREIESHLSLQLQAVSLLLKQPGKKRAVAISCEESDIPYIKQQVALLDWPIDQPLFYVPRKYTYELMRDSHVALAKSGTVSLELALHRCPTVVMYQLSPFNHFVAKYIMRLNLPRYCIANIILGRTVFPECMGKAIQPEHLFQHLSLLDRKGPERQACLNGCQEVIDILKEKNVSEKAAKEIVKCL